MNTIHLVFFIFLLFIGTAYSNLLDLNDKFLDAYKKDHSRSWLIKFYANWCGHCKAIEQTYRDVADLVKEEGFGNVIVGRIDCAKYTNVATAFGIRGFPTIIYIDSKKMVEYVGDRNKDDILEFVKRLSGPSIHSLKDCDDIEKVKKQRSVFFINFSKQPTLNYTETANTFHSTDWFYHLDKKCPNYDFDSIYSVKTSSRNNVILKKYEQKTDNVQLLNDWIRTERFPRFLRFSLSNINYLMNTNKILAIAMIKESKKGKFASAKEREYYENLEHLANTYPQSNQFVFGYTNQLDMINSIAIQTIQPIPTYVFINATSMNYYLYDEIESDEQRLVQILDSFVANDPVLIAHGGNTYFNRVKRLAYDGFIAVSLMFESNPILTVILFGFPITFFSFIVYCSLCSDIIDDRDDFGREELNEEISSEEDDENCELLNREENEFIENEKCVEKNEGGHLKSE